MTEQDLLVLLISRNPSRAAEISRCLITGGFGSGMPRKATRQIHEEFEESISRLMVDDLIETDGDNIKISEYGEQFIAEILQRTT